MITRSLNSEFGEPAKRNQDWCHMKPLGGPGQTLSMHFGVLVHYPGCFAEAFEEVVHPFQTRRFCLDKALLDINLSFLVWRECQCKRLRLYFNVRKQFPSGDGPLDFWKS